MKSEKVIQAKLNRLKEVGVVSFYNPEDPSKPYCTSMKAQLRAIRKALEWVLRNDSTV